MTALLPVLVGLFQSTLPYGSDQYLLPTSGRPLKFQSTLPYGSDLIPGDTFTLNPVISIHAPLRERRTIKKLDSDVALFQSTLPYGSDTKINPFIIHKSYFNPRSLTGATKRLSPHGCSCDDFNPRSLTGATSKAG